MNANHMVSEASSFLDSLSAKQRSSAFSNFPSDQERKLWFYTPTNHGGLPLNQMSSSQQRLVMRLISTGLSEAGYVTASVIMSMENILDRVEGFVSLFERDRGRDPGLYWMSVFGTPSMKGTWGWRFGGHHISLHFTIVDGQVISSTPLFFGADPANSPLLGPHLLRPLAAAEDFGRELVHSLSLEQRQVTRVSEIAPTDLVGANRTVLREGDSALPLQVVWRKQFDGELGKAIELVQTKADALLGIQQKHLDEVSFSEKPKGIRIGGLSAAQQEIARELLMAYVGRIHDDLADGQKSLIEGHSFDDLHFMWAGGIEKGEPHYYRFQGSRLFVEYDNTQRGVNHIHSVWRDLEFDFGGDPLAHHYVGKDSHH